MLIPTVDVEDIDLLQRYTRIAGDRVVSGRQRGLASLSHCSGFSLSDGDMADRTVKPLPNCFIDIPSRPVVFSRDCKITAKLPLHCSVIVLLPLHTDYALRSALPCFTLVQFPFPIPCVSMHAACIFLIGNVQCVIVQHLRIWCVGLSQLNILLF